MKRNLSSGAATQNRHRLVALFLLIPVKPGWLGGSKNLLVSSGTLDQEIKQLKFYFDYMYQSQWLD